MHIVWKAFPKKRDTINRPKGRGIKQLISISLRLFQHTAFVDGIYVERGNLNLKRIKIGHLNFRTQNNKEILMRQQQNEEAEKVLLHARELGLPPESVNPFLAEAAFPACRRSILSHNLARHLNIPRLIKSSYMN